MSNPAPVLIPAPAPGGRLVAVDGRPLPLRAASLRVDAAGGLARAVLEQRFQNAHPDPLHVTYLLPLPVDGAVSAFAFRIGDRRVVGEVDRQTAARERFEQALVDGRTAALVEADRPGLFTQEIGNIPPGAEVVAELTIDQRLLWRDDGGWEWRFPTVVGPRYLGAPGRVPDAERVTVDVGAAPLDVRMHLVLAVRDRLSGAVLSPSHPVTAARTADGAVEVSAEGALDRDVVVHWPVAGPAIGLHLDAARPPADRPHADAAYGLLTLVPPAGGHGPAPFPRDLVVLLDTSGSMAGEPLDQARRVVAALVESLAPADRLELIAFADAPHRWASAPVAATEAARAKALRWLGVRQAGGSTEMATAIAEALRPLRAEAQRQVVLVTDGLVGFEAEIVAEVARFLPAGSRLHVVGVGPAPNRALTALAARAGRGAEVLVGLGEAAEGAARRLVARTRAPLLAEIELDGSVVLDHAPARVPDVLASGPALVAVRLRPDGGMLTVRGRAPGGPWTARVDVPPVAAGAGRGGVVALYGREAVDDLEVRRVAEGAPAVDGVIERLGLAFQIATRLTSWVAVSEEPTVDPRAPWRRERMPHALPAGLSAEGLGLRAPQAGVRIGRTQQRGLAGPPVARASEIAAFHAAPPAYAAPTRRPSRGPDRLVARLARRDGLELTLVVTLERDVEWHPAAAEVVWDDGTAVAATVDEGRTTRAGRVAAGRTIRLTLRLLAAGPADPPGSVRIAGGGMPLTIDIR
jgi:Ca-activated chloride channel family protein